MKFKRFKKRNSWKTGRKKRHSRALTVRKVQRIARAAVNRVVETHHDEATGAGVPFGVLPVSIGLFQPRQGDTEEDRTGIIAQITRLRLRYWLLSSSVVQNKARITIVQMKKGHDVPLNFTPAVNFADNFYAPFTAEQTRDYVVKYDRIYSMTPRSTGSTQVANESGIRRVTLTSRKLNRCYWSEGHTLAVAPDQGGALVLIYWGSTANGSLNYTYDTRFKP